MRYLTNSGGRLARRPYLTMLPLLLLTVALAVFRLGADAVWYDEHFTLRIVGAAHYGPLSFSEMLANAVDDPWQPPLYYALVWGWGRLVGWSDVALRALSLLVGVLGVALGYRLGRDARSHTAGLGTALALGASAFVLSYLHELRPYALLVTTTAWVLVAYGRRFRPSPRERRKGEEPIATGHEVLSLWTERGLRGELHLALATAALLYSHYFGALLLVALVIAHLTRYGRPGWWRTVAALLVGGIAFLPWAWVPLQALGVTVDEGGRVTTMLNAPQLLYWTGYAFGNGLAPLTLLVVIGGVWLARHDRTMRFVMIVFGANLLLLLVLNAFVPVLSHVRYLLTLWPLLALLAGLLADALDRSRWRPVLAALVPVWLGLGAYHALTPGFDAVLFREVHREFFRPTLRWDAVSDTLADATRPGDAVLFRPAAHPWAVSGAIDYYTHGIPARYAIADNLTPDGVAAHLAGARITFIVTEGAVLSNPPPDLVRCDGTPYSDGNLFLERYAASAACCVPPETPAVLFGPGVALGVVDALTVEDNRLQARLGWEVADGFPKEVYSVSVQVQDAEGAPLSQIDVPLTPNGYRCEAVTIPLDDVPPGEYPVAATVYNWQTGERLPGGLAEVGTVTVGP